MERLRRHDNEMVRFLRCISPEASEVCKDREIENDE